ncbi:MAG: PHP domain-containing protein [Candidatus Eisenbacteria bacterium]|nr:PHP domain-containing protein [Candidatus Eisenbacteria bacterium]
MGERQERIRVEIHVHTAFSFDSKAAPEEVEEAALRAGVDRIAVTDHDTIEGALRLRGRGRIETIIGEEVTTSLGDVIGLFLESPLPPGVEPERTMDAIHEQGGLVVIPHPFDARRGTTLFPEALERCVDRIDAIEGWNGRIRRPADNERALLFARDHGLPVLVGSDAHRTDEIGRWMMRIESFDSPGRFLAALPRAEPLFPESSRKPERRRWLDRVLRNGAPTARPEPDRG